METLIYLILIAFWWFASFTILLPFSISMMVSETVRDKWLTFIFLNVKVFGPKLLAIRKQVFKLLEEHLSKRSKSVPLKVLEIGIGAGGNLEFYPENSHLTALDMNPSFIEVFNKNRKKYPQVNLDGIVINRAEDMKEVSNEVFDVVVCTHVLCTVKSIDSVMREIKRVLKPGGKFLFLEHVAFPKTQARYLVQLLASPLWALYFDGCCLDRNIADSINKAGFSDVHCEFSYSASFLLFLRRHAFGIATK